MKTLHIYRSEPSQLVQYLRNELRKEGEAGEDFSVYEEPVDYDELIKKIFYNDRILCWW